MLLTSGQISMGISSAIGKQPNLPQFEQRNNLTFNAVFLFSTLLFLSGYILQQQTVRSIQAVIKPLPEPTSTSEPLSRQESLATENIQWEKVAYVQIIQHHQEICSTAIIFAELAQKRSIAKRVILYPKEWDYVTIHGQGRLQERNTRLLRKAASRYNIILRAIEDADQTDGGLNIPLSHLFGLIDFERVLYFPPRGLIIDTASLDSTFAIPVNSSATHFVRESQRVRHPRAIMVKPSVPGYQNIRKLTPAITSMREFTAAVDSTPSFTTLFSGTADLKLGPSPGQDPEHSGSLHLIAYMRFTDPEILGPEFDIPRDTWMKAKPVASGPRKVWEDMYEQYRGDRMAVCGLDLEPMPTTWAEQAENNDEYLQL